jgi:hypothetical protein
MIKDFGHCGTDEFYAKTYRWTVHYLFLDQCVLTGGFFWNTARVSGIRIKLLCTGKNQRSRYGVGFMNLYEQKSVKTVIDRLRATRVKTCFSREKCLEKRRRFSFRRSSRYRADTCHQFASLSRALRRTDEWCLWRAPVGCRVYTHGWYALENGRGESDEVLPGERLRTFFLPPRCVFFSSFFAARCFAGNTYTLLYNVHRLQTDGRGQWSSWPLGFFVFGLSIWCCCVQCNG